MTESRARTPFFRNFFVASLTLAGVVACASPEPAKPTPLEISEEIDELVDSAMTELAVVPGFSLAVYTPAGTYARGFGVTDIETGEPVTAETAFYVASSTKSFTALAMNILHHHGDIDLDATLNAFAPDANFPAEIRPDTVSLRDLLTHTSGVSNGPIGFRAAFSGQHTPELNWRLLAESTPNTKAPYGTFQYTNEGYNILTVVTDRKLGERWQDLVTKEIIRPAGLTRTTTHMSEAKSNGWSIARPHFTGFESGAIRISLEKTDATMQSAGGMVMSANDALRWLELLVNDGAIDGEQIIPAEIVRETRTPYADVGSSFGDYKRDSYGLGWYIGPYKGDLLIHHFGGFAGFRAHVSYMPERKVGVAAFVNDSLTGFLLPDVIANFVYDRLAGDEDAYANAQNAIARLVARRNIIFKGIAADFEKRAAREWTLSLPKDAYAGEYENELYCLINVTLENGEMILIMGNLHSVAAPSTAPDSIRVELVPYSGESLQFVIDNSGRVVGLRDNENNLFERR